MVSLFFQTEFFIIGIEILSVPIIAFQKKYKIGFY